MPIGKREIVFISIKAGLFLWKKAAAFCMEDKVEYGEVIS
jgi:hypothetical protein